LLLPVVELKKLAEDGAPLILRNAHPTIANIDSQAALTVPATDQDSTPLSVAHCIGNQIEKDALQQNEVAADPCTA
jgi:hypothetical protein